MTEEPQAENGLEKIICAPLDTDSILVRIRLASINIISNSVKRIIII